ncbi:MAG: hypothetical protein J5814_02055 [Bacteroidaceae bacterium]|nr:hypothetical protein [Bacteroidaceae bacterium]
MPPGTSKVVGFPVENDSVGNKVEEIVTAADALIIWLQQVLVLVHLP